MHFNFAQLDPRPTPAADVANNAIFESGTVLGIEVTLPALADRCTLGNIDPQHAGGDTSRAAIEVAMSAELPPDGAILATVKTDLDSVGAMAVLSLRKKFVPPKGEEDRVRRNTEAGALCDSQCARSRLNQVAAADKFARGGWPGQKPFPTRDNPWPEETATAESSRQLAAIMAAVADFKVSLADRVSTMERWLLTGKEPEQYRAQVEKERLNMIAAMETRQIKVGLAPCRHCGSYNNTAVVCADCGGAQIHIATVESTHRAALMLGYHRAPVVVALHPSFKGPVGEPHRKFTVCQFTAEFVNMPGALAELNELEAGWGGSPTIGGSPQGVGSTLTMDQIVEVVAKHLR